jgi:hypothetical protein
MDAGTPVTDYTPADILALQTLYGAVGKVTTREALIANETASFQVPQSATSAQLGQCPEHDSWLCGQHTDNSVGNILVNDGAHVANLALLANYTASSFVASSDGHGGTFVEPSQVSCCQQTVLSHPHC